jgi:dolichol-phosphate mannosyltransferase
MMAGFEHTSGDFIIPMDADLQNDPEDILKLVAELGQGFDLFSG